MNTTTDRRLGGLRLPTARRQRCPHCGARPLDLDLHLRDGGDIAECPPDRCPTLHAHRQHPAAR